MAMPKTSYTQFCRAQDHFFHKELPSMLVGVAAGKGGRRPFPGASYHHIQMHKDTEEIQHFCPPGFPEGCLYHPVPSHLWSCWANSAHDDVVFKPYARVIDVLQWRLVVPTSWKPSSVL